jgi:hypothetical protein
MTVVMRARCCVAVAFALVLAECGGGPSGKGDAGQDAQSARDGAAADAGMSGTGGAAGASGTADGAGAVDAGDAADAANVGDTADAAGDTGAAAGASGTTGAAGAADAGNGAGASGTTCAGGAMGGGGTTGAAGTGGSCAPPSGWNALGAPQSVPPPGRASNISIALLSDGNPVIAWNEGTTIHTQVWRPAGCDGSWVDLGSSISGGGATIFVTPCGQTIRATASPEPGSTVTVETWNGTGFQPIGNPLGTDVRSLPALTADATGNHLTVAWLDGFHSLMKNIQGARWDGTKWVALSTLDGVLSAAATAGPSITMTAAGHPVVAAFVEETPPNPYMAPYTAALVAEFASATYWAMVGMPTTDMSLVGSINGPIVRDNGAGDLFFASLIAVGQNPVGVFQFDGYTWQRLSQTIVEAGGALEYDMALGPDGLPTVVVAEGVPSESDSRLFGYQWTGTSWKTLPSAGTAGHYARYPALAVDAKGRLVAAWIDIAAGAYSVVVARLEP